MHNLAATYSKLERHADALAMFEQVLEFRRRVLPANHPDIGEGYMGRDALHAVCRLWGGSLWFDLTCRHGHAQPCYDVLCA